MSFAATACLLATALILAGTGPVAAADTLVLEGGKRIEVDSWWREGEVLKYRKYGGTVGIPFGSVVSILDGDDGPDRLAAPPAGARSYPARSPATPRTQASPAPPEADATREWQAELSALESRARSAPEEGPALRRQMAVLWTQGGNQRYRAQDVQGAVVAYETAVSLDPALVDAHLNLASAYLSAGRNAQALREADRVLEARPQDVDALVLRGEALYRVEQLDGAIAAWNRAQEIAPTERTTERLEKALHERQVGGNFRRSDGAHFTLRYDGARAGIDLGREVLAFLEDRFDELVGRYNHLPPAVIVVIIYPTREFHEVTGTPDWTGGLFDGKIRVPIGGLHRVTDGLRQVLVHELTHSFVASKSRGNASRWMQEGLAQLEEGKRVAPRTTAVLAREYRDNPSRWGDEVDYASSLALVRFVIDKYGFGSLVGVLDHEGKGASESRALKRVLGLDTAGLFQAWGEELLRQELP